MLGNTKHSPLESCQGSFFLLMLPHSCTKPVSFLEITAQADIYIIS